MLRARLIDFRSSRGPALIGACTGDVATCSQFVNAAEQRLTFLRSSNGDGNWWGWKTVAFNVDRNDPFITTPREIARLEKMTVCNRWVPIQNQYYEFLDFGIGWQQTNRCHQFLQTLERGVFPAFTDLIPGYLIRAAITDASDVGKRALIQGTDNNDNVIYTQDALQTVIGEYLDFVQPFVDTTDGLATLTGIQKDITNAPVNFYMVHPTTGAQTLILTMEPSEKVAAYRRYQITGLPKNCCDPQGPGTTAQVMALAKLDFIPVRADTDYLTPIGNIEALIEECQAIRYEGIDSANAAALAGKHHSNAIGLLNGEINHYLGKDRPATIVAPFGSARLRRQRIGLVV